MILAVSPWIDRAEPSGYRSNLFILTSVRTHEWKMMGSVRQATSPSWKLADEDVTTTVLFQCPPPMLNTTIS